MTRKAIFVSEETHAHLTRLIAQEIVKNKGKRVYYEEMIEKLINFYRANN